MCGFVQHCSMLAGRLLRSTRQPWLVEAAYSCAMIILLINHIGKVPLSVVLCAHLADGLLHFVEVGGLVEVAGHHLGQQRRQHIRKSEQDQTPNRLRIPSKPR